MHPSITSPRDLLELPAGTVVFFDLDDTLLNGNSAKLYVRSLVARGEMRWRDLAVAALRVARYRLDLIDVEAVSRKEVAKLEGSSVDRMEQRCQTLFDDWIVPRLFRDGVELVERHRRAGHVCVLITASTEYVAKPVATRLEMDDVLATRLAQEGGRFTGVIEPPFCFGDGKLQIARRWASATGHAIERAVFYSDSISDAPLLRIVRHPIATNPDPKLAVLARQQDWLTLSFDQ